MSYEIKVMAAFGIIYRAKSHRRAKEEAICAIPGAVPPWKFLEIPSKIGLEIEVNYGMDYHRRNHNYDF